jgi:hypothetical protein
LLGGLEHLKIETRLIDEMFARVMGLLVWGQVRSGLVFSRLKKRKKEKTF